ncbi:FtsK/SpoIIIE family protein, putative EssC component of Type VII secretion system [[Actinomadura] parvosata subsp. kistnae]|uniref:hypothetical protein n=1 Tax=[Actinomadura] parvosata TaxID=1955412 RepID=UPI000D27A9B6|nr:FtsK/SpoIIIE family protein, putative EssC component of Type VII secretion system [Actinomadura parvosata subsp. kistnae]
MQPAGLSGVLMYVPMLAGGAAMALMFTAGGNSSPIMYVASGLFAVSMLGMTAGQLGRNAGERKNRLNGLRRDYFRYLAQIRKRVRKAAVQQREALEWSGPAPDTLWWVAMGPRLWERRPATRTSPPYAWAPACRSSPCSSSRPTPSPSRTSTR